jgi:hypothetical protein
MDFAVSGNGLKVEDAQLDQQDGGRSLSALGGILIKTRCPACCFSMKYLPN